MHIVSFGLHAGRPLYQGLHRAAVQRSVTTSHGIGWFVIPGCVESIDRISAWGLETQRSPPPASPTQTRACSKLPYNEATRQQERLVRIIRSVINL